MLAHAPSIPRQHRESENDARRVPSGFIRYVKRSMLDLVRPQSRLRFPLPQRLITTETPRAPAVLLASAHRYRHCKSVFVCQRPIPVTATPIAQPNPAGWPKFIVVAKPAGGLATGRCDHFAPTAQAQLSRIVLTHMGFEHRGPLRGQRASRVVGFLLWRCRPAGAGAPCGAGPADGQSDTNRVITQNTGWVT